MGTLPAGLGGFLDRVLDSDAAQLLNDWLTVQHYGVPMDYWEKYPDRIDAVDAAAIQAAARKYVDLGHFQWVCVGNRKAIQDVLAKYGPVSVVGCYRPAREL